MTGKIGNMAVDLLVTPEEDLASAVSAAVPRTNTRPAAGEPARLARLRSLTMPSIVHPVMFDTPEADAILSALEVFPPDNPWNQVVSDWPVHPNSKNIIASIGPQKPFRCNTDMGFILVPPNQTRLNVKLIGGAGESDPGPYPVPDNMPIEGWPIDYRGSSAARKSTLDDVAAGSFPAGRRPARYCRGPGRTGCSTSFIRPRRPIPAGRRAELRSSI